MALPPQVSPPPQKGPVGRERPAAPEPEYIRPEYRGADKLLNKAAMITGGDSGIGRAVAVHFAREGADVAIVYLSEHREAEDTRRLVEREGRRCLLIAGDVGYEAFCRKAVDDAVRRFGRLDVLVNNAAEPPVEERLETLSAPQMERMFRTNIFSYFLMAKAAAPHLKPGGVIINTTSVSAYRGNADLLGYSSTKGAIVSFTRSLAKKLLERQIRVNGVAPGPEGTPPVPAAAPSGYDWPFGQEPPMGRVGQPSEVAPSYVFLASADSSYMTGQVLHPNGGDIVST